MKYINIGHSEWCIAVGSNLKLMNNCIVGAKVIGSVGNTMRTYNPDGKIISFCSVMKKSVVENGKYSPELLIKLNANQSLS